MTLRRLRAAGAGWRTTFATLLLLGQLLSGFLAVQSVAAASLGDIPICGALHDHAPVAPDHGRDCLLCPACAAAAHFSAAALPAVPVLLAPPRTPLRIGVAPPAERQPTPFRFRDGLPRGPPA